MFHVKVGSAGDRRRRGVRLKAEPEEGEPQILPVPLLQRGRVRHDSEDDTAPRGEEDR